MPQLFFPEKFSPQMVVAILTWQWIFLHYLSLSVKQLLLEKMEFGLLMI